MDWLSFAWGFAAGVLAVLVVYLAAKLTEDQQRTPTPPAPAARHASSADLRYAEIEAHAIRHLGARGGISAEDAERIAREHVARIAGQR